MHLPARSIMTARSYSWNQVPALLASLLVALPALGLTPHLRKRAYRLLSVLLLTLLYSNCLAPWASARVS